MSITINGTTGVSGVDGSSTVPAFQGTDTDTGLFYSANTVSVSAGGSKVATINAYGIGLGTGSPSSGIGITFPAAQSASSDANTLDDYEEGTWTPNVGGNATYFTVTGQYVKIGRLVVATFDMTINILGTGSSNVISGLPFAGGGNSQGQAGSVGYFANLAASVYYIALRIDIGGSVINTAVTQGIQSTMTAGAAILGNSSRLIGTVTYQVS